MAHSYWIIKDPTPLKTLPTMCLYTCALLINLRWAFLINNNYYKAITITDAVCVCFVGVPIVSGESGYRGSLNVLVHSPANQ